MANPSHPEKLVYLALKDIFNADHIPATTLKTIRKKVDKHRDDVKIRSLIRDYGADNIANIAKALMDDQVFQSVAKAKTRFPEVIEVSLPSQSNPPIPTGPKAMASSAATVQSAGTYSPERLFSIRDEMKTSQGSDKTETSMLVLRIPDSINVSNHSRSPNPTVRLYIPTALGSAPGPRHNTIRSRESLLHFCAEKTERSSTARGVGLRRSSRTQSMVESLPQLPIRIRSRHLEEDGKDIA
jgi:hypothetical protein